MIGAFQYFTTAFVLSQGNGGPASSTLFYSLLLYSNAFSYFKMGYGSAMAWLLFAFVFFLTWVVFRSANRWVYYEGESA
jgi:multiple sugar transport system permease protein